MKKDKKIYITGNRVNGELIKEKLKEKRMSERYASRQIGCSYNALNLWTRCMTRSIDPKFKGKLAKLIGVSEESLVVEE